MASKSQECSEDCKTSRCVAKCEREAHDGCKVNVIATQHVFNGPVTSTPVSCPTGGDGSACSAVKGTVANRAFFGGSVTFYAICPIRARADAITTVIATVCSSATDGTFSVIAPNTFAGQNGCYGLVAVAPSPSNGCGVENFSPDAPPPTNGDPGWNTCTGAPCPAI